MRYTGEAKKEERQKAAEQAKGAWEKLMGTISPKEVAEKDVEKGIVE
jgi:hypothetical protein